MKVVSDKTANIRANNCHDLLIWNLLLDFDKKWECLIIKDEFISFYNDITEAEMN